MLREWIVWSLVFVGPFLALSWAFLFVFLGATGVAGLLSVLIVATAGVASVYSIWRRFVRWKSH